MIVGKTPFYRSGMDQRELFKAIVRCQYSLPPRASDSATHLIQGLLTKDPNLRLGSLACGEDDIINHSFFRGLDREKLRKLEISAPFVPKIKNAFDASNFEDWSHLNDVTKNSFPSLPKEKEEIFDRF
jgi:serine/threonine protein kinase